MLLQYQRSSWLFVITWVISASYQILSVYPHFVVALQCNAMPLRDIGFEAGPCGSGSVLGAGVSGDGLNQIPPRVEI